MANHAVIVGVSGYFDPYIEPLPHVRHAVATLAEALVADGGFEREHVAVLVDSAECHDPLQLPLRYCTTASLARPPALREEDFFLFYFIGHGYASMAGDQLMTIDTSLTFLEATSLPVESIARLVRPLHATQKMLVFDACRNTLKPAHDVGLGVGASAPEGLVSLYGCRPEERAWVPLDSGSAVPCLPLLTEAFIRAVADPRCRSLSDMYGVVRAWVTERSLGMHVIQTPELSVAGLDPQTTGFLSRAVVHEAPDGDPSAVDAQIRRVRNDLDELYTRTYPGHLPNYGVLLTAARPLRELIAGPRTYRTLAFEFLERGNDADLYAVSNMVRNKPDPILLEPILEALSRRKYRGTVVWQALDAVATLLAMGAPRERSKSDVGLRGELLAALKRAAQEHPTRTGSPFSTAVVWGKTLQICRGAELPEDQVLPPVALQRLREVRASGLRQSSPQ